MNNREMPTLNVFWTYVITKVLFAALAVAVLGGAVLMIHSSPAVAEPPGWGCYHSGHACE